MCVCIRGQKEILACMWVLYCKVMARAVVKVAASSKGIAGSGNSRGNELWEHKSGGTESRVQVPATFI